MYCTISGEIPEVPVVSKATGHIYEKRLIEKYIEEHGKCPVTGEPMTVDDLLPVVSTKTVKPRPPSATSIPGILSLLQNEWDALMLETYAYKQQLESLRQELSHSLYQHDAALRVIARLARERDEARQAVGTLQAQGPPAGAQPSASAANGGAEAFAGLTPGHIKAIDETAKTLSKERKAKKTHPTLAKKETIAEYYTLSTHPLHKASQPGITSIDIDPKDSNRVATGGVDGDVIVFNRASQEVALKLSGHKKEITSVRFHGSADMLASSSRDKTAKVWTAKQDGSMATHTISAHSDEVTGVSFHPCGDLLVTTSSDKTWMLHDLNRGVPVTKSDDSVVSGNTCCMVHPDGLIMGTGSTDGAVYVWDVKSAGNIARFTHLEGCPITSLCFSENGYYLATSATDNVVRIWDLRKQKCTKTIELGEGVSVSRVRFDLSGGYLGIAASDLRVVQAKSWDTVKVFSDHSAHVTDVAFGPDAKYIASTSMDRTMKFYGTEAMEMSA